MKKNIFLFLGIYFWTSIPLLFVNGFELNAASITALGFSVSVPLLIQLAIKGSSVPFFLQKYSKWTKEKYSYILYRNSLMLGIFLPFILIFLANQYLGMEGGGDMIGWLFAAALITTFYVSCFLIITIIYSAIKQIDNKDTDFIYSHHLILVFAIASLIIVNSMQYLLLIAKGNQHILENHITSISNFFYNNNILNDMISLGFIAIYIGLSYTIINKKYKVADYIQLNKIMFMILPLFVINHIMINQINLLARFGEDAFYKEEFNNFTINTLQFSILFILGMAIILLFHKLNDYKKIKLEKFEFVDKSITNRIFTFFCVFIFLGSFLSGSSFIPYSYLFYACFLSLVPVYISRQRNKIDFLIQNETRLIKNEKKKTEKILFNVLPKEIASELNEKGNVMPKGFDEVSILFTDFKNFTNASSTMSPKKLVGDLNFIFHLFDEIIEQQGVEKIKTIGDAYMVASGVPNNDDNHAEKCIETGLKMIKALKINNRDKGIKWDMRIGIHSGSVVAGLVGKNRITYDIWGDTVNIASRMESSSEANRINISGVTYDLVKHLYEFDYRGKIDVKGKGDIDMYFVNN